MPKHQCQSGKLKAGWPRQGNHETNETDERNAGNRRAAVDGGASIVISCRRGVEPPRERCLALLPPMLLFAREAWPKANADSLYYQYRTCPAIGARPRPT